MNFLNKFFDSNKKDLKKLEKIANQILEKEPEIEQLSQEEIQAKTEGFKNRLIGLDIKEQNKILEEILPEVFALAREASYRVLGMKHFKVQLMGGIVIHRGDIAEMRTGEGKSLTTILPTYLNALTGRGVHVITVNEYLSSSQYEELRPVYEYLGLTTGLNLNELDNDEKREAYHADLTYTTNSELGFDYLRDNMVVLPEQRVMQPLNYAVIDEVDSILIDEARTPLIISGEAEQSKSFYKKANMFAKMLDKDDYKYDQKTKSVTLTDSGIDKAEHMFGIDNIFNLEYTDLLSHINTAIKVHVAFTKNKDYMVQNDEVLIIDQFTGRTMSGRRYSEGLHQALEAKENVPIQNESKTIASITYQNFFRMYNKLSGMTGTAKTEEEEFKNIYNMLVTQIPTNRPIQRKDNHDLIYLNQNSKFKAVIDEVERKHAKGQPILLGTVDVNTSEYLSQLLTAKHIHHNVLNAKNHEREAEIVSNAGQKGAVTIATNMAGRGTDIKLGDGVEELGGLAVIGTERHESRRIDDQLRGRSGRQGDRGDSRFYLSLQDELMVRFGSEGLQKMMGKLGMDSDTPLESRMISRSIESAQKRVEGNNYDARKQVLEYDEVLRKQREIIYNERNEIIDNDNHSELIQSMLKHTLENAIRFYLVMQETDNDKATEYDDFIQFLDDIMLTHHYFDKKDFLNLSTDAIFDKVWQYIMNIYNERREFMGDEDFNHFEKAVLLQSIDQHWTSHIDEMDQLRQGIHLRSYAQQNPLRDYQNEGYTMFENMLQHIEEDVTQVVLKADLVSSDEAQEA